MILHAVRTKWPFYVLGSAIHFVLEIVSVPLTRAKPINTLECSSSKEQEVKCYDLTFVLAHLLLSLTDRRNADQEECVFFHK